jgi:hypothetical protein
MMSRVGKGKCLECGREGEVREEHVVYYAHPLIKDDRTLLGKFQLCVQQKSTMCVTKRKKQNGDKIREKGAGAGELSV